MVKKGQKTLVIGPSWIGDMVMAQSLFIYLKERGSDVIDVVAPEWAAPVLNRMPEVRSAESTQLGHGQLKLYSRWKTGSALRSAAYDQAIVLPRSLKSALIPFFANIKIRTGYRGEMRYGVLNDIRPMPNILNQTVKRFVALGMNKNDSLENLSCPKPSLTVNTVSQTQLLERFALDNSVPAIGIMPGAEYGPAKQWPAEHHAELVRNIIKNQMQVWLFGSIKDKEIADRIIHLSGEKEVKNLCGETSLPDVIDLIAATSIVISNDSGLMHIAAAVDKPVIALYGSSSSEFTPPLGNAAKTLHVDMECRPCFARTCRYGHYKCLYDITPDVVMAEIYSMLN